MIVKFIISLWRKFRKILEKDEYFVFWVSLLFYFLLYFNLNNKTLVLFFALFILVLFIRFKNLGEALFWGFIASLPFIVGKTYFFNLIPASKLFLPNNPEGYNLKFTLTTGNIIAIFIFPLLIKKIVTLRKNRLLAFDFSLFFLFLLIFFVFLSTINSKNSTFSFLFFLQFLQEPLVFLCSGYLINWRKKTRNIFVFLLVSQAIFESFWVLLQFASGGALGHSLESYRGIVPFGRGIEEEAWRYRPTGTFDHANYVAAFLLPIIILNFSSFWAKSKKAKQEAFYFFPSFFLVGLALMISLSRSAWLSLFVGIFFLTWVLEKRYHFSMQKFYQRRLLFLSFLVLAFSPFFILPRIISSFSSFAMGGGFTTRAELARESLEVIRQNFFLGTGLGMSVPEMFENNPRGVMYYFPTPVHNWYLLFASEAGVFALLAFLFLLNFCLRKILVSKKKNIFRTGVLAACLAMLTNGIFQPFLGDGSLLFIFLGILNSQNKK